MKVTVCIPTFNRPDDLRKALDSVLAQDELPDEILIGDDSTDSHIETMIQEDYSDTGIPLRYHHHRPSLRQPMNMNWLFENARESHCVLLHDDDTLLPNAITQLKGCFQRNPELTAAFGKQYIIDAHDVVDSHESALLNQSYFRSPEREGLYQNGLDVGILQMFPNDGYMVKTDCAKAVKWHVDIGNGCEYDFGVRLAKRFYGFYYLDQYVANYRVGGEMSNASSDDAGFYAFKLMLEHLEGLPISDEVFAHGKEKVKVAIARGASLDRGLSWSWYFSKWHRGSIFTLGGLRRLLILLNRAD